MTRAFALVIAVAGCPIVEPNFEPVDVGDVAVIVPSGWSARDLSTPQTKQVMWSPIDDGDRKQSIVVVRTPATPALAAAPRDRLATLLARAQPRTRSSFAPATEVVSKHGLYGAVVAGHFVPVGAQVPYQRFHAVLVSGDALVHVIYTAVLADRDVFDAVVESVHRKGG